MKKRSFYHLAAWAIWFLSALFMFYKYSIEVSPSVMTSHLMSDFAIDGTQLGNLAACFFYAYLLMQIPGGLLIDRFGPRKVTSIAIALCGIGTILFATAHTLFVAQCGRFLSGVGGAFAALNCLKLTANWFPPHRFAFMTGLMMSLGMLGAVGGQAPLSLLMDTLGWRPALLTIGIVGVGLAAIFWLIVRDHSKHKLIELTLTPALFSLKESCLAVFKNKQSWLLSLYSGLAFAPVTVFGGLWGVSYICEAFQIEKLHAAHLNSLIFVGFAVGAPLWGWLSDLLKNRKKLMYGGTIITVLIFCTILYGSISLWFLGILLFAFGFFISSFLICFTMIREINPPIVAATAIGFMNAFDAFLGAISDPLTGRFLDLKWDGTLIDGARVFSAESYTLALSGIPIALVMAITLLFFIKETYCQPHLQGASTLP